MAIVGAGVVGLAIAYDLLRVNPSLRLVVIDKETKVGSHQTGHNTGVIHAGVYYQPGSLRARLCVTGAARLYRYCDERGIAVRQCGKLIVALNEQEKRRLTDLQRRGVANGVKGLRILNQAAMQDIEPFTGGIAALHSPTTGTVNYCRVGQALADDIKTLGGHLILGQRIEDVQVSRGRVALMYGHGVVYARHAVFAAGAESDVLARAAGASTEPRIVPFRGAYLRLRPERRTLVTGMLYPVPRPDLPFFGVHLTRRIDNEVIVGPTALLVAARDGYNLLSFSARDAWRTLSWPGTMRMARRWWHTGISEIYRAINTGAIVRDAAKYVPTLKREDVMPGPVGVRAQALGRSGAFIDDFVFSYTDRAIHVRNAASPAATACLAIGEYVAERARQLFDLSR